MNGHSKEVLLLLHVIQTARRQNISDQQYCRTQVLAIKSERALSVTTLCVVKLFV